MFRLSHSKLYTISGLVWLGVGLMLLNTGLVLIMSGFQTNHFSPDGYSIFFSWLSSFCSSPDNAAILLIGIGLILGFVKGRFVLQKAALKSYDRISQLESPTSLHNLYTRSNLLLIATMIAMGMGLRYFGIPCDIRGWIDVIVGSALTQGSVAYFQYASFAKAT